MAPLEFSKWPPENPRWPPKNSVFLTFMSYKYQKKMGLKEQKKINWNILNMSYGPWKFGQKQQKISFHEKKN